MHAMIGRAPSSQGLKTAKTVQMSIFQAFPRMQERIVASFQQSDETGRTGCYYQSYTPQFSLNRLHMHLGLEVELTVSAEHAGRMEQSDHVRKNTSGDT